VQILQNDDVKSVLKSWLVCNKKHNKPQLHYLVCQHKCPKKHRVCDDYTSWYENNANKEPETVVKAKKRQLIRRK